MSSRVAQRARHVSFLSLPPETVRRGPIIIIIIIIIIKGNREE